MEQVQETNVYHYPNVSVTKIFDFIITTIFIVILHEAGHIIGLLLITQGEIVVKAMTEPVSFVSLAGYSFAVMFDPAKVVGFKTLFLLPYLVIPILLQTIYIQQNGKSKWWMVFILYGMRGDLFNSLMIVLGLPTI